MQFERIFAAVLLAVTAMVATYAFEGRMQDYIVIMGRLTFFSAMSLVPILKPLLMNAGETF